MEFQDYVLEPAGFFIKDIAGKNAAMAQSHENHPTEEVNEGVNMGFWNRLKSSSSINLFSNYNIGNALIELAAARFEWNFGKRPEQQWCGTVRNKAQFNCLWTAKAATKHLPLLWIASQELKMFTLFLFCFVNSSTSPLTIENAW